MTEKKEKLIIIFSCLISSLTLFCLWLLLALFLKVSNFLYGFIIALFFGLLTNVVRFYSKNAVFSLKNPKHQSIIFSLLTFFVTLFLFGVSIVLAIFTDVWSYSYFHASLISCTVTGFVLYLTFIGALIYINYHPIVSEDDKKDID